MCCQALGPPGSYTVACASTRSCKPQQSREDARRGEGTHAGDKKLRLKLNWFCMRACKSKSVFSDGRNITRKTVILIPVLGCEEALRCWLRSCGSVPGWRTWTVCQEYGSGMAGGPSSYSFPILCISFFSQGTDLFPLVILVILWFFFFFFEVSIKKIIKATQFCFRLFLLICVSVVYLCVSAVKNTEAN